MNRAATGAEVGGAPPGSRVDVPRRTAQQMPTRLSGLDVVAFALPAVSFVEVTIVGRLMLTEVLLLVMLPWLWGVRDRLPLPRWFLVVSAGWFVGQVVTDLVVESVFTDYARGWAAVVFTVTNFAAILVLVSSPRRARLFALGLAVGGVLGYLLVPNVYAASDPWKWAFALPVGYALAAILSGPTAARMPWLAGVAFGAFGLLNLFLGYRSLGGICLLAAAYLILSSLAGHRSAASRQPLVGALIGVGFLAVAVAGTLQLYDFAASGGLLGSGAQAKYEQQAGSYGVLIGGRSELLASTQAIIDSPLLGHGSWAKDYTYVELLADRRLALGYEVGAGLSDVGLIPAHSYLMGSWVWAGVLGGVFWLAIVAVAVRLLARLYSYHIELAPLLAFSTFLLLWSIAFSPYGFSSRLTAPFAVALCLLGLRLMESVCDVGHEPVPAPGGTSGLHANRPIDQDVPAALAILADGDAR